MAVDEGDSILMECVARGFPIPKIHWYQNNQRTPYNGSVIQIPAVSSQHTGIYRCVAENVAGNDSATAVLAVRGEYSAICFQAFQKKNVIEADTKIPQRLFVVCPFTSQ